MKIGERVLAAVGEPGFRYGGRIPSSPSIAATPGRTLVIIMLKIGHRKDVCR